MESQQASPATSAAAYSIKLGDGGRYSDGKREYDGMFNSPMKLGSRVEDYREIFAISGSSSIPMLDVPELNEKKASVDLRGSRPDYAKIFGGFGEADFAMPYDDLISRAEKEMKSSRVRAAAESMSQFDQSTFAERKRMSSEESVQSSDGRKHVNMSYHKTNSGGRIGKGGMTHVAQLHAVPGYSRVIDDNVSEEMKEGRSQRKAYSGPLLFGNGPGQFGEHHRTLSSISNDVPFDIHRSAHPSGISSSPSSPLSGYQKSTTSNRSTKSKLGIPKSASGSYSPPFLDDEVNANSTAATSAAAVRKAIEEAQEKIKFAKELMERKKEGRQGRSRLSVNHEVKSEKREAKSTEKTYNYKKDEELYRRHDTSKKQYSNGLLAENSAEVSKVTLDIRDETGDSGSRQAHTVNNDKVATITEVDFGEEKANMTKSLQGIPEAISTRENKLLTSEIEQDNTARTVTPSIHEYTWKEKAKASVLQDKFENIMRMLRGPADFPDVEVQLLSGEKLDGLKSEEKQGAPCTEEKIKGRSNEGIARAEDESAVKVNSWLNDIDKGHAEPEDYPDEGDIEKKQSFDLREDDVPSTWAETYSGKTSQVRSSQSELDNEGGENRSAVRGEEEVKEKVEKALENNNVIDEDDEINRTGGEQDSFPEFVETEKSESDVHQRSGDEESVEVTREIPRCLDDNVEVAPSHKADESENVEQIDEVHRHRELAFRVIDDVTNTSSGLQQLEKESDKVEDAFNAEEEEDVARAGCTTSSNESDGIGEQRDVPPEPIIIDENGVCSSEVAFDFEQQHTKDSATVGEETCCPEKHVEEEATAPLEELKENVDDAEVGSTGEANVNCFTPLSEEQVSPASIESRPVAEQAKHLEGKHLEGASNVLEEHDKDTASNSTSSDEERLSDDGIGTSTSQQSTVSEKEEAAEAVPSDEKTSEHAVDETEVTRNETLQMQEREAKHSPQKDVDVERQQQQRRKKQVANEDLEKEKQRIVVERAIREARERAFVEAREKAEKAAADRDAAEAQRKAKAARERSARANAVEKAATEARLKAERAAVERATSEARERALEKALSDKAPLKGRNYAEKSPAAASDNRRSSTDQRSKSSVPSSSSRYPSAANSPVPTSAEISGGGNSESSRSKASLEKQQQMAERAAKALEEKNMRDLLVQKEQAEKNRLSEILDAEIKRWSSGKERNLRVLLSTLHYILGPDSGWQAIPRTDLNSATAVRKAYKKATLFVHPDKLQQRGASIRQKYVCEKVFELLKDAWNRFSADDR